MPLRTVCCRADHLGQHRDGGRAAKDSERLDHCTLLWERVETGHEEIVERRRDGNHRDGAAGTGVSVRRLHHARQFAHVQRHTLAALGNQGARVVVEATNGQHVDQLVAAGRVERTQPEHRRGRARRRACIEPSGDHHHRRMQTRIREESNQHVDGRGVCPLQIFHCDQQRLLGGETFEPRQECQQCALARCLGLQHRHRAVVGPRHTGQASQQRQLFVIDDIGRPGDLGQQRKALVWV